MLQIDMCLGMDAMVNNVLLVRLKRLTTDIHGAFAFTTGIFMANLEMALESSDMQATLRSLSLAYFLVPWAIFAVLKWAINEHKCLRRSWGLQREIFRDEMPSHAMNYSKFYRRWLAVNERVYGQSEQSEIIAEKPIKYFDKLDVFLNWKDFVNCVENLTRISLWSQSNYSSLQQHS